MPKLVSLSQAIAEYVHDDDLVYAAGFRLIPFAAGRKIIRQGKKNLTLAPPDIITINWSPPVAPAS